MIDSTRVSLKDIASSQKSATFSHLVIKSNQNKAPLSERGKSTPALAVLQDPSPAASFLSTLRLFSGLKALTFDCGRSAFPDFSISRPVQTRPNSDAHPPHPSDCPGGPAACLRPRHRPAFPPPRPARRPALLPARHPRVCPPPLSPRPRSAPGRAAGGRRGAPRSLAAPRARAQPEDAALARMPHGEGGGRAGVRPPSAFTCAGAGCGGAPAVAAAAGGGCGCCCCCCGG